MIVVIGVLGSGRTTTGRALAKRLGWLFEDGDDRHGWNRDVIYWRSTRSPSRPAQPLVASAISVPQSSDHSGW